MSAVETPFQSVSQTEALCYRGVGVHIDNLANDADDLLDRAPNERPRIGSASAPSVWPHLWIGALTDDLKHAVAAWNDNLKPFVGHKTADQILTSLKKYLTNL